METIFVSLNAEQLSGHQGNSCEISLPYILTLITFQLHHDQPNGLHASNHKDN